MQLPLGYLREDQWSATPVFTKGTDLSVYAQEELDAIAGKLTAGH